MCICYIKTKNGLFDELFGLLRALLEKYCKYPKRLVPEYNLYTLQVHEKLRFEVDIKKYLQRHLLLFFLFILMLRKAFSSVLHPVL